VLDFTRIDKFIDVLEGFDQAGATFFLRSMSEQSSSQLALIRKQMSAI